jgi:transcriptional regulator GlxA family with amidase domain
LPNLFRLVSNSPAALQGYLGLSSALSKGALPAATRERIALAVAIGFPAVAATHGRSSITWRSVMKVLITALARGGLPPSRLRRACDYMVSRLGADVSLQEVAASVELSTGHFSTAFKQSSGVTPRAWMRRQRIDRAKTLLHDANLNLTQIAIILGYANQSSLGVAFKRETGVTPTQWRVREIG